MNIIRTQASAVLGALLLLSASVAISAQVPKYKVNVPETVMTPDKLHTGLLGDLEFIDGMPSKGTVKKAYDFLDTARGAEALLNGIPAASIYGVLEASRRPGDFEPVKELPGPVGPPPSRFVSAMKHEVSM